MSKYRPDIECPVTNPTAIDVFWTGVDMCTDAYRKNGYPLDDIFRGRGTQVFIPDDEPEEDLMICPKAKECDLIKEHQRCFARVPHKRTLNPYDSRCPACVPYEPEETLIYRNITGKPILVTGLMMDNNGIPFCLVEPVPHKATKVIEEGWFCFDCGGRVECLTDSTGKWMPPHSEKKPRGISYEEVK